MPKYDNVKLISRETGEEIPQGSIVKDFRGNDRKFLYVSQLPYGNSEGKVMLEARVGGECYPSVLGARIVVPNAD